jgi:hypothetical protein
LARLFTKNALKDFIARSMGLPLTVVDGMGRFTVAASMGAVHDREVTGGGKARVLNEKSRAVNTLIGNVKTALTGTYHAIKFAKYAIANSPRCNSASTGATTCARCSAACCERSSQPRNSLSEVSGLLRYIANQVVDCA